MYINIFKMLEKDEIHVSVSLLTVVLFSNINMAFLFLFFDILVHDTSITVYLGL